VKVKVKDAIRERRSVRAYQSKPVPDDKLANVLETARLAPSAANRQLWKFIVVKDPTKRKALAHAAASQYFVGEAPVIIAAVALQPDRMMSCGVPTYAVDLAIAVDHMTLAAIDEGLGTCWIGAFSQEEVRQILNIPKHYKVVTLLPLGFPADSPKAKSRKSLEEIICYDTFK
jgi:nitroreductase